MCGDDGDREPTDFHTQSMGFPWKVIYFENNFNENGMSNIG